MCCSLSLLRCKLGHHHSWFGSSLLLSPPHFGCTPPHSTLPWALQEVELTAYSPCRAAGSPSLRSLQIPAGQSSPAYVPLPS
ncbi:unnamed protein product [Linum trigynum]|uniref:Uncharacterized protein n=1 Tax=Linum trigynum TaxID=586398 RepID=A0AAV2F0M4_9ROSI